MIKIYICSLHLKIDISTVIQEGRGERVREGEREKEQWRWKQIEIGVGGVRLIRNS